MKKKEADINIATFNSGHDKSPKFCQLMIIIFLANCRENELSSGSTFSSTSAYVS